MEEADVSFPNSFIRLISLYCLQVVSVSPNGYVSVIAETCPSEMGYYIIPGTKKCLRFVPTPKTWDDAAVFCAQDGGHLVTIDNADVAQAVTLRYRELGESEFIALQCYFRERIGLLQDECMATATKTKTKQRRYH